MPESLDIQKLLSLPVCVASKFHEIDPLRATDLFVDSDPAGCQLGSGGGTAHLLVEAWRSAVEHHADTSSGAKKKTHAHASPLSFQSWIRQSRKLLVHGSGESRRLPGYAPVGKPLIPIPRLPGARGQRPDQCLFDLQLQTYERLFWHAPLQYRLMLGCGDVLLRFSSCLPVYPAADVLIGGLAASPEEAQRHGVMFCPINSVKSLAFFLQKPSSDRIQRLAEKYVFYLDTGVWLFSERAVNVLMRKCGWNAQTQQFAGACPLRYDLFDKFGPALGSAPTETDDELGQLTCAVLPLRDAHFHHFGTNRSLLASVSELQKPAAQQRSFGHASMDMHGPPVVQHSDVRCRTAPENRFIWIENSNIPATWQLTERHVLTAVPANGWKLSLPPGTCLDFVPIDSDDVCIRAYGFDDTSQKASHVKSAMWLDKPAPEWFAERGISLPTAGICPEDDIQNVPLFPVLTVDRIDEGFLTWLFAKKVPHSPEHRDLWLSLPRLSSHQLLQRASMERLARKRNAHMRAASATLDADTWSDAALQLNLAVTARLCANGQWVSPPMPPDISDVPTLAPIHDRMFRFAVGRLRGDDDAEEFEKAAFSLLRRLIVSRIEEKPVQPAPQIQEDQIVWGRSPVRLDLAGGWTDTPPYCLAHGGNVVNVAVDLNGQPPIQVFARIADSPEIHLRSIDIGVDQKIRTYEDLKQYSQLGSGFVIARAALALAGLEPRFHAKGGYGSLKQQLLKEFGGGIELSMVCAIPKGSGLGTSSILAATVLGTLSELSGLHWNMTDLFAKTLALEQMLTSGGGWQDQIGGVAGGLKLSTTIPGLSQCPVIRWLPGQFFSETHANRQLLLYYTGLTRVAHDILGEIVRGLFLNSSEHLGVIGEIGLNASFAADVIQRNSWEGLCEAVRRSWHLNQRLDSGTNPPKVQAILDAINDYTAAAKLLGAGGGGYMLILAKDSESAQRIRRTLTSSPPNSRARFVDLGLSTTGFQVTRS